MGKYQSRQPPKERPWRIHPIWRGIGCLLMLVIPIMAYAGAVLLVQANQETRWITIPPEMAATVNVPGVGPVEGLYAILFAAVLLMLVGFGIMVIVYGILYRMMGVGESPVDSEPIRSKPRTSVRR